MLCLHLQIVYFPGQYQLRECRGRRAEIGMEVRIAVRWGDGGRRHREEHQFQHVVRANLLPFYSPAPSLPPRLRRRVLSFVLQRLFKEAASGLKHSPHTGFPEAHLHLIHQRDAPSLYNYNEAQTENLYLSALMILLLLSFLFSLTSVHRSLSPPHSLSPSAAP